MGFIFQLAVRWGGRVKPGRVITDFVTFPDVAPTIMQAAGVKLHAQITGQSFLPQLLSTKSGRIDPDRDHTLLEKNGTM